MKSSQMPSEQSRHRLTAFAQAFIKKSQRQRYLSLLALNTARGHDKLRRRLAHDTSADIDPEHVYAHVSSWEEALTLLADRFGVPPDTQCYVFSDVTFPDDTTVPLAEALEQLDLEAADAILSIRPGELAYFIGEDGTERRVLWHRKRG